MSSCAFRIREGALLFDLVVDAEAESEGLAVSADASLLDHSAATLTVVSATDASRVIGVRRPPWAESVALFRNGYPLESRTADWYVLAESVWSAGDEVRVEYGMGTELLRRRSRANYRAVQFGPWILGTSEESDPAFFGEGRNRNRARMNRLSRDRADLGSRTVQYVHGGYAGQPEVAQLLPVAGQGLETGFGRWQIWLMSEDLPNSQPSPVFLLLTGGKWMLAGVIALVALVVGGLVVLRRIRRRQRPRNAPGG